MKHVALWTCALAVALSLSVGSAAQASPVTGSEAVAGGDSTLGGSTDVTTATTVSWTSFIDTASKTGDFVAVADDEVLQTGPSTLELHTGVPGTAWSIGSATWGTFVESTITAIVKGANAITVYVDGTFTPGSDFPAGITASTATMILSLTQAGGAGDAVSTSGTLVSPPVQRAPEMSANAFFTAVSLLAGSIAVIFGRRKSAETVVG
jgi:hypothetical protein